MRHADGLMGGQVPPPPNLVKPRTPAMEEGRRTRMDCKVGQWPQTQAMN